MPRLPSVSTLCPASEPFTETFQANAHRLPVPQPDLHADTGVRNGWARLTASVADPCTKRPPSGSLREVLLLPYPTVDAFA